MPLAPLALDADGIVLSRRRKLVEEKVRAHDLGFPGVGTVADRIGQRPGLEVDPQLREIEEIVQRNWCHLEAAAGLGPRQPFRHQMRQRLAERAYAGVVALSELTEPQPL